MRENFEQLRQSILREKSGIEMTNHRSVGQAKVNSIVVVPGLALLFLMITGSVLDRDFEEGTHYTVVERESESLLAEETSAKEDGLDETTEQTQVDDEPATDQISVVEYFSYGCPHCYRLEPFIEAWLDSKADDVNFSRVAAPTRTDWIPYARAYYIAEVLGITDKVHSLLFRAIYVNKQPMGHKRPLKRMFENVGDVEPEQFEEAFESDEIPRLIQAAAKEMKAFGIKASPTIIVDETYLITPESAGDLGLIFEIVDFLVAKIKTERSSDETAAANEPSG